MQTLHGSNKILNKRPPKDKKSSQQAVERDHPPSTLLPNQREKSQGEHHQSLKKYQNRSMPKNLQGDK